MGEKGKKSEKDSLKREDSGPSSSEEIVNSLKDQQGTKGIKVRLNQRRNSTLLLNPEPHLVEKLLKANFHKNKRA